MGAAERLNLLAQNVYDTFRMRINVVTMLAGKMMLNTWRGLMLAAGVAAIPAFAQAECPPPESLDRYAQTARDALVALDGLVPEEQQQSLEDRYTAMSILRWHGQGREAILNEQSALDLLSDCIDSERCDAEPRERSGAGPRTIAPQPSDRLVYWANTQLECEVASPEIDPLAATEPVSDAGDALADPPAPEAEPDPNLESESEPEDRPDDLASTQVSTPEEDLSEHPLPAASEALAAGEDTAPVAATDLVQAETDNIAAPALTLTAAPRPESDVQRLVRHAATAMKKGDFDGGVDYISQVCFHEAEQADPVLLCEYIFNHYDRLALRADPIAFLAFTDQLCRLDYTRGCAKLATYFGVTNTADAHSAAIRFYDRACNSGDADACAAASDYFFTGRASVADPVRARDTLYRACDLGRLDSCQGLAEFYVRGVGGGVDLDRALEVNEVSCPASASDNADICVAAANFVLINLEAGANRAARVRTFTKRACAIGHATGCAWHADNLEYGIGGDVDMAGAARARRVACQYGHAASCKASS